MGTGVARRALGALGIVAVLFTPTASHSEEEPERAPAESVLATTLAPGEHAGVVRPPVRIDRTAESAVPSGPGLVPALGAMAALVLAARPLGLRRPVVSVAAPGPVLLRAPTRSPPILAVGR
jgi:hypothetical protein